jgi:hypothetical protein
LRRASNVVFSDCPDDNDPTLRYAAGDDVTVCDATCSHTFGRDDADEVEGADAGGYGHLERSRFHA